jgi:hypothetical protein
VPKDENYNGVNNRIAGKSFGLGTILRHGALAEIAENIKTIGKVT